LKAKASARAEFVGRNFGEGVVAALRARPEVNRVETANGRLQVELRGETDMAALVSLVVASGGLVEEVRRDKASLEDVFLTLVEEDAR
jgi:ABC-2 type transport system ATP-binding protein